MRLADDRELARLAIERARAEGSPVGSDAERMADVAIRRWNSAERRLQPEPSWEARVEDLAQGFVQYLEVDPKLVGPLIADYRYVAECVARAVTGREAFELPMNVLGHGTDGMVTSVRVQFQAWIRQVARQQGFEVDEIDRRVRARTFDSTRLAHHRGHSVWALHNVWVDLVAFVAVEPAAGPYFGVAGEFVDQPLGEPATWGPTVLDATTLNSTFDEWNLRHLGLESLLEIERWNPETIGQIIFNYWD